MSRVKVTKRNKPIDPLVASMVAELTKDYRETITELEKRVLKLEKELSNQTIHIYNHRTLFGDLHTCFATLQSSVRHESAKKALIELGELAERSLSGYQVQTEDYINEEPLQEHTYYWSRGSSIGGTVADISVFPEGVSEEQRVALCNARMVPMSDEDIEFCEQEGLMPFFGETNE